jgi:hypothetical protein
MGWNTTVSRSSAWLNRTASVSLSPMRWPGVVVSASAWRLDRASVFIRMAQAAVSPSSWMEMGLTR